MYQDLVQNLIRRANQETSPETLQNLVKEETRLVTQDLEDLTEVSWSQVDKLLQEFLTGRSALPQTKLTATPPYQKTFNSIELQRILAESLPPVLAAVQKSLVKLVKAEGTNQDGLTQVLAIGIPTEPKEAQTGFQLWRLAELVELRMANYRIDRIDPSLNPEKEFGQTVKIGLLFRWGQMQTVMVAEAVKISDFMVLLSNDYGVGDKAVWLRSALFFDRDHRLTLARFTKPVEIGYAIFHPSSPDYPKIEATGIPMQVSYWAKELIEAKGSKLIYPKLLKRSQVPFPRQLNLHMAKVPQNQNEKRNWIKDKLGQFLKQYRLDSVFVKPAAGSKGGDARAFSQVKIKKNDVIDFLVEVIEKRGDVLVQELVKVMPLTKLIRSQDLENCFGRAVQFGSLDWVIRCAATRDDQDRVLSVGHFIVANDRGVANVGQGAVTVPAELLSVNLDFQLVDRLTQTFTQLVRREAEQRSALKVAWDGRSNHVPGYLLTEWLYDVSGRFVFLEGGIGIGICRSYQHYLGAVKKIRDLKDSDYWFTPIFKHLKTRAKPLTQSKRFILL